MGCERFQPMIAGRLYGEIAPEEDGELAAHLEECEGCRASLADLQRVRAALRAGEPDLVLPSRVVVLRERWRLRPALLAASLLGAAVLAGAAAGGGYAIGRTAALGGPGGHRAPSSAAAIDAATRDAIDRAVADRVAAIEASRPERAAPGRTGAPAGTYVTPSEMDAALARLERAVRRDRAADVDYVLTQVAASEVRTGQRIGQTNQALRYVALASNPSVSEQ